MFVYNLFWKKNFLKLEKPLETTKIKKISNLELLNT